MSSPAHSAASGAGVYVVVGASGEMGRRFARRLAERGTVVAVVRERSRIPEEISQLECVEADLRDPARLREVFAGIVERHGGVTGVVNAAGVVAFGEFGTVPDEAVEEVMAVNAAGVVELLGVVCPLLGRDGWVVNLSGVAAETALVGMGVYCASKAAASAAMRVAGRELRRRGARAIDVRVGHTETGLAGRAVWGEAPRMPTGLDPEWVVERVLAGIDAGERELGPEAFTRA